MQKSPAVNKKLVLDTHALMGYLHKEAEYEGLQRYFQIARHKKSELLLNEINLGELYYRVWKNGTKDIADTAVNSVLQLPIKLVSVDQKFIMAAATWKAQYAISYADAFVVETAVRNNCPIITGDPELDTVSEIEIIRLGKKKK